MALLARTYCFITSTMLVTSTGCSRSELVASVASISERPASVSSASTMGKSWQSRRNSRGWAASG